jgi:hypothetical protein
MPALEATPSPVTFSDVLKVLRAVRDMRTAQRKFFTNKNQALKQELIQAARAAESRVDIALADLIEKLEGNHANR